MQSSNKLPLANTVGGATGHNNIASMWCSHFKDFITLFNVYEIRKVIVTLEKGKSGGLDNLPNIYYTQAKD